MAKRIPLSLALVLLLFTGAAYAETFGAVLTPSQEVPPVTSNGFGFATVTLDPTHTQVTVNLIVTGLTTPINNGHIHGPGLRGVAVGTKVNFVVGTNIVNGRMNMTFSIAKDVADDMVLRPEMYYVNIHTTQNGGGEVRGQLTALDTLAVFVADLRGANEAPNPVTTNAVGSALVTIDPNNVVTFDINATALVGPTLAHIHAGVAGVAASPIITFASNASAFTGGRVKGTVSATPQQAAEIKANPSAFYVNVHTTANGGGEIRGQLTAANEYDIAVAGKVSGGGGENFVSDVRVFNASYQNRASALLEYFQAGTTPNTNATNSIAVDIPARGTAVLNDIAGASGFNTGGTTGGVRVTSASALAVSSRIYDDRRARNGGTIGQFVPGVSRSSHLRRGVLGQLQSNGEARTNIGFFNPNTGQVDLRLELRDAAGALLAQATRVLEPLTQQQNSLAGYFPGVDLSNRAALSVSFDASGPIVGYGSVIDNVSSDQIFVSAASDPGTAVP